MADADKASRIKHGLIPVLVAMRGKAERERRSAEAAKTSGTAVDKPKKKRGWFS